MKDVSDSRSASFEVRRAIKSPKEHEKNGKKCGRIQARFLGFHPVVFLFKNNNFE